MRSSDALWNREHRRFMLMSPSSDAILRSGEWANENRPADWTWEMFDVVELPPPPPPPPAPMQNVDIECWVQCGFSGGACASGFCTDRGACCRQGSDVSSAECAFGAIGCSDYHCCAPMRQPPPSPPLEPRPPPSPPWTPYVCDPWPCRTSKASLLGDVARTTVGGTDARTGSIFLADENIFGPFENGFGPAQDAILGQLGCTNPSLGHVPGGIDTRTAEQMVAHACGVTLPRVENDGSNGYVSLLDECGGHTQVRSCMISSRSPTSSPHDLIPISHYLITSPWRPHTQEYHFHERLSCLYDASLAGHSPRVGAGTDASATPIYGKWEDQGARRLPSLDACNAHFGVTPDSNGAIVYHHHVNDLPPFTIGCYGPAAQGTGHGKLVSLDECKALYSDTCDDGDQMAVTTSAGTYQYDPWCPCFLGGRNVPA